MLGSTRSESTRMPLTEEQRHTRFLSRLTPPSKPPVKTRRSIKKAWQAAWLLRAVSVIDLTTLAGGDTKFVFFALLAFSVQYLCRGNVKRLCFKAKTPVRQDLVEQMGVKEFHITTGAVCVYPSRVPEAVEFLKGTGIPVASVRDSKKNWEKRKKIILPPQVATGFPAGQTPLETRLAEIRWAVEHGAKEIDIVINRTLALGGRFKMPLPSCRFL